MKKLFAVILSAAMAITAVPMQAFAAGSITDFDGLKNAVEGTTAATVNVEQNIVINGADANVTLNLDGDTIQFGQKLGLIVVNGATLKITGTGTIKETPCDYAPIKVYGGGTVIIEGDSKDSITLEGWAGIMVRQKGAPNDGIDTTTYTDSNSDIVINVKNAKLVGKDGGNGFYVNGNVDGGEVTFNNVTINSTGDGAHGIYQAGKVATTITGGSVTGESCGIVVAAGTVKIDGTAVTGGTGESNTGTAFGGSVGVDNAAIAVIKDTDHEKGATVTVKSGTFTAGTGVFVSNNADDTNIKVNLEGGTFNAATPIKADESADADNIAITGGKFSQPVDKNLLSNGSKVELKSNNGSYSYHATVEDAQNAIERKVGGTILDYTGVADGGEPTTTVVAPVKAKKYDVTVNDDIENGTVTVDAARAKAGSTVTITATPDKGYELKELTVLDSYKDEVDVEKGNKDGKFTFDMPKDDVTVDATFKKVKDTSKDEPKDEPTEQPEEKPAETPAGDAEQTKIVLTMNQRVSEVNGEFKVNDVAPILRNDRTMLPIRMIAEALGATVAWNDAEQKVTITKDDMEIVIYIGQAFATVNNTPVALDAPAFIENGRTYLPLRFVAENLGATVTWDAQTQQVTIIG